VTRMTVPSFEDEAVVIAVFSRVIFFEQIEWRIPGLRIQ